MKTDRLKHPLSTFVLATMLLHAACAALGAEPSRPQPQAGLSGVLAELWAKLRSAAPRANAMQTAATQTMTAGIRGAEATESELTPYWKGDQEQDPTYRAERAQLQAAQDLADAGNFAEAAKAYEAFVQAHAQSTLAPQAQFGAALMQAALGDRAAAHSKLESFLRQNARHPLTHDAEQALAALR